MPPPSSSTDKLLAQILTTEQSILNSVNSILAIMQKPPQPQPPDSTTLEAILTTQRLALVVLSQQLEISKAQLGVAIESRDYLEEISETIAHDYSIRVRQTKSPKR
jgi:hypothetical protein